MRSVGSVAVRRVRTSMNGDRWRLADAGKRRPVRGGMPVNEFARYAERSRQFTDRHEPIVSFLKSTFHPLLLSGTSPTDVTSADWS